MIPPNEEVNAINIKEVAKAAGVSVATISRVLNHPEQVQPETKTHVLAVMESLNYRPTGSPAALTSAKPAPSRCWYPISKAAVTGRSFPVWKRSP